MFKKILLAGDNVGISQLLSAINQKHLAGIMASCLRPQYLAQLQKIAYANSLEFLEQPKYNSSNYQNFMKLFLNFKFDLLICNSYSMIIQQEMLDALDSNAVNIHWSLLPKNRGPNPTQWAIIKGEDTTGITLHYMNDKLDSGDIIAQEIEIIDNSDTWVTINKRLKLKAEKFIKKYIPIVILGSNPRLPQNELQASVNFRLTSDSPEIHFNAMDDKMIYDLIRAQVFPLQGAFLTIGQKRMYFQDKLSMVEIAQLRKQYYNQ